MSSKTVTIPHLPNAISPPDEHALYKDNFATGNGELSQSLLTSHTDSVMEMCFSCFINTKYKCLGCKLPICNNCSVFEENDTLFSELYVMRVFSFYF